MRLTTKEQAIIKTEAKNIFGPGTRVFLFGSRVDDSLKGGDIDLYIETAKHALLQDKIFLLSHLKLKMGDQKIDVVVNAPNRNNRKIFYIARQTGIEL